MNHIMSPLYLIKRLPSHLLESAQQRAIQENPYNESGLEGVVDVDRKWKSGRTLQVSFLDGSEELRNAVIYYAREWCLYANIHFNFVQSSAANIRVSFQRVGHWSVVGTDALEVPITEPTINFEWSQIPHSEQDLQRTILHEFGHVLGLLHEHQSPTSGIQWNRKKIIDELTHPNYGWSPQDVQDNILDKYEFGTVTQYLSLIHILTLPTR